MSDERVRIGMTPPHPGSFIRTEILDELGLSVSRAADILGVRRATLSDLVNEKAGPRIRDQIGLASSSGIDFWHFE